MRKPYFDQTAELLIKSRARIASPERWAQGTAARAKGGQPTFASSINACAWCATGVLESFYQTFNHDIIAEAISILAETIVTRSRWEKFRDWLEDYRKTGNSGFPRAVVVNFNDTSFRKHAQVLDIFDRAISACL